ncbi:MAG: hypothetical protein ACREID_06920 [Planctomycetota bacterium]
MKPRALFALALLAAACGQEEPHDRDGPGGHDHVAPHGGALVTLGDHFAHIEVTLDPETGALSLYVLDAEAEKGVRVSQEGIDLSVTLDDGTEVAVALRAFGTALTGERPGDTSQFLGAHERLRGLAEFTARIDAVEVRGRRFEAVAVDFPHGDH